MKKILIAFLFLCCGVLLGKSSYAQMRQPDSLRNKQLAYNRYLKEQADKKLRDEQLKKEKATQQGAAVVMYDSKGNKVERSVGKDGSKITTTTILIPAVLNRKFSVDTINTDSVYIKVLKAKRDNEKVAECLSTINRHATAKINLMPAVLEAVEHYCTLGEISDELRKIFGEYK